MSGSSVVNVSIHHDRRSNPIHCEVGIDDLVDRIFQVVHERLSIPQSTLRLFCGHTRLELNSRVRDYNRSVLPQMRLTLLPHCDNPFPISVRKSNGEIFSIEVQLSDTVQSIKERIFDVSKIPQHHQILILKGIKLQTRSVLGDVPIQRGDTVDLTFRLSGGVCAPFHASLNPIGPFYISSFEKNAFSPGLNIRGVCSSRWCTGAVTVQKGMGEFYMGEVYSTLKCPNCANQIDIIKSSVLFECHYKYEGVHRSGSEREEVETSYTQVKVGQYVEFDTEGWRGIVRSWYYLKFTIYELSPDERIAQRKRDHAAVRVETSAPQSSTDVPKEAITKKSGGATPTGNGWCTVL